MAYSSLLIIYTSDKEVGKQALSNLHKLMNGPIKQKLGIIPPEVKWKRKPYESSY